MTTPELDGSEDVHCLACGWRPSREPTAEESDRRTWSRRGGGENYIPGLRSLEQKRRKR